MVPLNNNPVIIPGIDTNRFTESIVGTIAKRILSRIAPLDASFGVAAVN